GSCSFAAPTLTCSLGALASSGHHSIAVRFVASAGGAAQLAASVAADEIDLDATDDSASATTSVRGIADVGVSLDAPRQGHVGTGLDATATVTNHGPET